MTDEQAAPPQGAPKRKSKTAVGCGIITVLFIIVAYGCSRQVANAPPDTNVITRPNGETVNAALAQVVCESEVKDRLVSPTTARFQRPTAIRTANRWKLEMALDSQNAFGAMLRSEWVCLIDGTSDTIEVTQTR